MHEARVAWVAEMARAARANLESHPATLIGEAERAFSSIPYRFLGDRHPIVSLDAARSRGWAACADAAAAIAAAAYAYPWSRRAVLCVESPPDVEGYSHVRVILDGIYYDPYEAYRADVPPSCEWSLPVAQLLELHRPILRAVGA